MDRKPMSALASIKRFARTIGDGESPDVVWHELDRALAATFGHRLFTVLAYDREAGRLARWHSSRPDVHPVGGLKQVTQSPWSMQVLQQGRIFRGSNREDIKAVFSEYERLWSIGCESVMNIPVRKDGVTLGTLNLLGDAGLYDQADIDLALVFAQLAVPAMETSIHGLADGIEFGRLERV